MRTLASSIGLLLACTAYGQSFQDGDFSPGAFIQVMPAPSLGLGGTATVTRSTSGGVPGAYLDIALTVNSGPGNSAAGAVFISAKPAHALLTAPISSIYYSQDLLIVKAPAQGVGPALRQGGPNGKIYVAPVTPIPPPPTGMWTPVSAYTLTSDSFSELSPGGWLDPTSHPDFSPAGSPIEFGFWQYLQVNMGCTQTMYGCGQVMSEQGIDNWSVVISSLPIIPTLPPTNSTEPNSDSSDDPVSTATGEYYEQTPELLLGGPLALNFTRYYASFLKASGTISALGNNWTHNFDTNLALSNGSAVVKLFKGRPVKFTQTQGGFELANTERYPYQLIAAASGSRFLDPSANLIYSFDSNGRLTRIEDRNGNALTITRGAASPGPDQVSDGLGRSLSFTYSSGKLTRVQDQTNRSISFSYTGDDLTAVTGANGKTTQYSYASLLDLPGLLLTKTLPEGNTPVTQKLDSSGRVVTQTDGLGSNTTLAFDTPSAGATTITTAINATIRHTYEGAGNLVARIDPAGQTTTFAYDGANRLTQVTDRDGGKRVIAYDPASGLKASETDALGNVTQYSYAAQTQAGFTFYNLQKVSYPDTTTVTFSYDASGNVTAATDRSGQVTKYSYNSHGRILTGTDPAGGVTTYTYNDDGTLASSQKPPGGAVLYAYDAQKRLSKITNPDQTGTIFTYDDAGNLLEQTNEIGRHDVYAYDGNNHQTSLTTGASGTATLSHDPNGNVSSYAAPALGTQILDYDPAGRLTGFVTPAGDKVTLGFDPQTRLTSIKYCSGQGLSFGYTNEGRISAITDGNAHSWKATNDNMGNVTQIISALGRQFLYTYDSAGRLATFTDALSRKTTFTRDGEGRLTSLQSPDSSVSATLNGIGLPVTLTDANGHGWQWTYNAAGQRTSASDPLGRTVSYQRDARGRTTKVSFTEGTAQLSYDGSSNLTRRLYSDGLELDFTYDSSSRPLKGNGFALSYDGLGKINVSNGVQITRADGFHISAISYAGGKTVTYAYDCNGLVTSVTDWAGGLTKLGYDSARKLVSIQRPNGVATQYTYDSDGRLAGIIEKGTTVSSSIVLTRDLSGNITSADRTVPLGASPAPGFAPYSYDAAGQIKGGTYDSLGHPLSLGLRAYVWDLGGRLTNYSGSDGSASFGYDAYGTRVSRSSSGISQAYVINYALPRPTIATVRQGGEDLRYYVYLPDGTLLYSLNASDNRRRFFHFDETGSTIFLTADDGSLTDSYANTPYGEHVQHSGASDNPFIFLGAHGVMQEGSTGLYYMGFRYYDSAAARFLTRAPGVEPSLKNPNLYQYTRSNPLVFIDPMGRGPNAARDTGLAEGGDFGQLVLSLPEMFRPGQRVNTRLIPPALVGNLLDFARGTDLRKETKP